MDAQARNMSSDPTPEPRQPKKLQLLAAGLNAHGQLSGAHSGQDLTTFTPLTEPTEAGSLRLLYATWSSTVLHLGSQILALGQQQLTTEVQDEVFSDAFGDHDNMLGCLDQKGRLWLADSNSGQLECHADPSGSPLIGHIALASNGKIALTFKQAPNGRLCHILCFDSLPDLVAWYTDPTNTTYDAAKQHFMMQGQPRQLLAGTGTFLLRMEDGEVYSWGDARYASLGRSIAEGVPAERPGVVEALGGLKIRKVACVGWLNGAVSEDGACYLWGAGMPGTERRIRCLREAGAGGIVLVELTGEDGGEPLDVLDVAVGDNHVTLLAEGNRCFAVGENKNGQLGLGHTESFVEDWAEIPISASQVESIVCGPKSTYAFASSAS